jgi:hypothetical protein
MESSEYGVDALRAGEFGHVVEGVDDARVGATADDNDAVGAIEEQGLVVGERVGAFGGGISEEGASGVFEISASRDGSGGVDARGNLNGFGGEYEPVPAGESGGSGGVRDADAVDAITALGELCGEGVGVKTKFRGAGVVEDGEQRSGVVVVAVTADNGVELAKTNAEFAGVGEEGHPGAGVEEDAGVLGFNVE